MMSHCLFVVMCEAAPRYRRHAKAVCDTSSVRTASVILGQWQGCPDGAQMAYNHVFMMAEQWYSGFAGCKRMLFRAADAVIK